MQNIYFQDADLHGVMSISNREDCRGIKLGCVQDLFTAILHAEVLLGIQLDKLDQNGG